jgi:hypothetical protein
MTDSHVDCVAGRTADKVISELQGRSGCLEQIDDETMDEIRLKIKDIIIEGMGAL